MRQQSARTGPTHEGARWTRTHDHPVALLTPEQAAEALREFVTAAPTPVAGTAQNTTAH